MTNRSNLNYSAAAKKGTKRAATQSTLSAQVDHMAQHKLGQFQPSKEFLEFLTKRFSYKILGQACPKLSMEHGICIYTGTLNDYKV